MKKPKLDPIPKLTCIKKSSRGKNDGLYSISIPLEYIIEAVKTPAAYYEFKFVGILGED